MAAVQRTEEMDGVGEVAGALRPGDQSLADEIGVGGAAMFGDAGDSGSRDRRRLPSRPKLKPSIPPGAAARLCGD